jgi:hypothetical protein
MLSRRAIVFALILEGVVFLGMAVVVADVRAHTRLEIQRGVNTRGFRGPLTIHKVPPEHRVAIVGGTAAYGYAVDWPQSLGADLQNRLRQEWRKKYLPAYDPTVVNLAELGAGAGSYAATLRQYADLAPDVVCIYDGYAPVGGRIRKGREQSVVFRKIEYLPILGDLMSGGSPWSMPADGVDPFLDDAKGGEDPSCARGSAAYCEAMVEVVDFAMKTDRPVVVVTPPYVSARHRRQQESLAAALTSRFGGNPRFSYVAIGASADVHDSTLSADGVNLNAAGYEAVADRIVDLVFDAIHQR